MTNQCSVQMKQVHIGAQRNCNQYIKQIDNIRQYCCANAGGDSLESLIANCIQIISKRQNDYKQKKIEQLWENLFINFTTEENTPSTSSANQALAKKCNRGKHRS